MKRIFTLIAAVGVALGMSAAPKQLANHDFQAQGLLPEVNAQLMQKVENSELNLMVTPDSKPYQKVWYDQNTKATWRLTLELLGHVGDLYSWGNDAQGNPLTPPTLEEMPYYGVMASFEKTYDDPASPREYTYWILWWPTIYEHTQFVDEWYNGLNDVTPNWDPVPFDAFCNEHENPEYLELSYCSRFYEVSEKTMPYPDFETEERNGQYYIVNPTPAYWGMQFYQGSIGNNPCTSGIVNGLGTPSQFTFQSWDALDQWLEADVRMFTNGTRRSEFTYSGKSRVQGWSEGLYKLPEYGDVHIFNAGVGSSQIYGDTDLYGTVWGPLQKYFIFGIGKYLTFVESYWEGAFDTSKVRIQDNPQLIEAEGIDPTTIENYFFGMLFSEVGAEPTEGTWNMAVPVQVGNTNIYQVTPVANCIVPYAVGGDAIPEGFVSIVEGDTDFCTTGSLVKTGTTEGLQLLLTNGFDYYTGFYKNDVVYHYDEKNMALTKTFAAIGTQEPSSDSVNEIEAGNEAPVYYNLQGVRVANPEKGIVIKVQGNKATKLFL